MSLTTTSFGQRVPGVIRVASRLITTIWWGGLTFYSAVVVPAGSEQIGSFAQGTITREVTVTLNQFAAWVIVLALWNEWSRRDRLNLIVTGLLGVTTIALRVWHEGLSDMMDANQPSLADDFYQNHAVYLWMTTLQWLLGLSLVLRQGTTTPPSSPPKPN